MESGNQYVHEVKKMRELQIEYFKYRNGKDLKKAKEQEIKVDEYTALILKKGSNDNSSNYQDK